MNSRHFKYLIITAFASILADCSSVPLDKDASTSGTDDRDASSTSGTVMDPFHPESPLAQKRSVYFEFHSYSIPSQYRGFGERHSRYLSENAKQNVRIKGHADERGRAEENMTR